MYLFAFAMIDPGLLHGPHIMRIVLATAFCSAHHEHWALHSHKDDAVPCRPAPWSTHDANEAAHAKRTAQQIRCSSYLRGTWHKGRGSSRRARRACLRLHRRHRGFLKRSPVVLMPGQPRLPSFSFLIHLALVLPHPVLLPFFSVSVVEIEPALFFSLPLRLSLASLLERRSFLLTPQAFRPVQLLLVSLPLSFHFLSLSVGSFSLLPLAFSLLHLLALSLSLPRACKFPFSLALGPAGDITLISERWPAT